MVKDPRDTPSDSKVLVDVIPPLDWLVVPPKPLEHSTQRILTAGWQQIRKECEAEIDLALWLYGEGQVIRMHTGNPTVTNAPLIW